MRADNSRQTTDIRCQKTDNKLPVTNDKLLLTNSPATLRLVPNKKHSGLAQGEQPTAGGQFPIPNSQFPIPNSFFGDRRRSTTRRAEIYFGDLVIWWLILFLVGSGDPTYHFFRDFVAAFAFYSYRNASIGSRFAAFQAG